MTSRVCNVPRTRTLLCNRPATLKGGYWVCPAGHVVRDGAPPEPPMVPVTVASMRAAMDDQAGQLGLEPHRFDGETYSRELDQERLSGQLLDVYLELLPGRLVTLAEVSKATGHPEASVSARIRDLRKERFGKHDIRRSRVDGAGLHVYQLVRRSMP